MIIRIHTFCTLYQLLSTIYAGKHQIPVPKSFVTVVPQSRPVPGVRICASGSFSAKSEWTLATTPFQHRNLVPRSRGTSARRASKTPSAFFQDSCGTRYWWCRSDSYKKIHTPSSRSRVVYSSIHISRASAPNCSRVESQRVSISVRGVGSILPRVSHKTARWARQLTQLALITPAPFWSPSS